MASRLATILEKEYKTKGVISGLTSATGKAALEKLDIRNALFGGSGIGSAIGRKIFGKGYSATRGDQKVTSSPVEKLSELSTTANSAVLESINISSKIAAKNSTVLPSMARDMFLMKQNIIKLVKLQGGTPQTKAGDWFARQTARENAFESRFSKTTPSKVTKIEKDSENKSLFETILGAFNTIISAVWEVISTVVGKIFDLITSIGTLILEMRMLRGLNTPIDLPDVPDRPTSNKPTGKAPTAKGRLGRMSNKLKGAGGQALNFGLTAVGLSEFGVMPSENDKTVYPFVTPTDVKNGAQRLSRFASEGESISQEKAMEYFVNKGLSPEQAAGIVGNLMRESNLNSAAQFKEADGSISFGIAQWNKSRLEELKAFAGARGKEITDINTQMDFILHELATTHKQAGEMLLASKTPKEAAYNFAKYYEKPQTVDHLRMAYAEQAYSKRNKDLPFTTNVATAKTTGDLINQTSFDNSMRRTLDKGEQVVVLNDNSQTNNNQQSSGGGTTATPWNENAYRIFAERAIGF